VDAPSGTALSLAADLIRERDGLEDWSLEPSDDPSCLHIEAIREGEVNGRHAILYDSPQDTLRLEHDAKSREGFAAGALLAAAFLRDKTGTYTMQDMLSLD
jgi:4-hydroxy-tetrahydrodipicolinate reductase